MKKLAKEAARMVADDLVECFIDDTLARSKRLRALTERVVEAQRELRSVVDDETWARYLELEMAVNARSSKQLRVLFHRLLTLYAAALSR